MMNFEGYNIFDICEAYLVLEWDYNNKGWLEERPSNQRRLTSTSVQLARMKFVSSPTLSYDNLTEEGQEIYHMLEKRYGFKD